MRLVETTRFTWRNLPHWEVASGRYFVTVRCADSLPREAIERLKELESEARRKVDAGQKLTADRIYFRAYESYLHEGHGACLLRVPGAAEAVVNEFKRLEEWEVDVPHFTVMPNHCHALIEPRKSCVHQLSAIMKRVKGRSAIGVRRAVGGTGPLWQREWFDRWMRDDAERAKTVAYIRNNPVKAGLVHDWQEHPWTK